MFTPKFQSVLKKDHFYPNREICLGSQMILIIDFLKQTLPPHVWYGADVDAFAPKKRTRNLDSCFLKKIGSDLSLTEICSEIDQFLSGVFFAIESKNSIQNLEKKEISTEDKSFRELNMNGVLIEIRTFDTSSFEIYTENETLIQKIANKFKSSYSSQ